MFAFGGCLIVGLYSDLAFHDTLGILGGFGLRVDIGWQNAVYLARIFGGELGLEGELDICAR